MIRKLFNFCLNGALAVCLTAITLACLLAQFPVGAAPGDAFVVRVGNTGQTLWRFLRGGGLQPALDATYDIGAADKQIRLLYAVDIAYDRQVINATNTTLSTYGPEIVGIVNATGNHTVVLPSAPPQGRGWLFKDESGKMASAANVITFSVYGGTQTIDGVATGVLNVSRGKYAVYFDGVNYQTK